jgi:hypothetical protein
MGFIDVEWGGHLHKQKSNELFIRSLVKKQNLVDFFLI